MELLLTLLNLLLTLLLAHLLDFFFILWIFFSIHWADDLCIFQPPSHSASGRKKRAIYFMASVRCWGGYDGPRYLVEKGTCPVHLSSPWALPWSPIPCLQLDISFYLRAIFALGDIKRVLHSHTNYSNCLYLPLFPTYQSFSIFQFPTWSPSFLWRYSKKSSTEGCLLLSLRVKICRITWLTLNYLYITLFPTGMSL